MVKYYRVRIMLRNTLGKNIRAYREEYELSQAAVAKKLNICRQTLSAYERGESTPNIYMLLEIARVYHVSLDELTKNIRRGNENKEMKNRDKKRKS